MDLREAIARACGQEDLTEGEMASAIGRIMDGEATPAQIAALLIALKMKGETVAEIVGAARAMRARAAHIAPIEGPLVDTCGTGGDGAATVNVSTLAALVVAACGVRVAKHGNRAISSRAGSADLLEALGVDVAAPVPVVERCLREVGIGFFFAPAWHGATRHAAPVRREIGVRTLFNLLGPLTNPAGAQHQLMGVYDPRLVEPLARALGGLGTISAMVVHGEGGLDEFAPAGPTVVAELRRDGTVASYELRPADFGLAERSHDELRGGDAAHNAELARALLSGADGAARTCVVMTAAATLVVAGKETSLSAAARRAEAALDGGEAARVLSRLVEVSRAPHPARQGVQS